MTTVAVTGATGFIGRHVVDRLEARGIEPVTRRIEIGQPPDDAFRLLGEPEVLIHLAWGGLPNYGSDHHLDRELPSHQRFLKMMVGEGLKSVTVAGTCLEYGLRSGALDERFPGAPVNAYAKAKDALRKYLETLEEEFEFDLTWARLFYLYGEGQAPTSLLPQLDRAIENGEESFDMSGGEQLRDYLPVEEVAELIVALALNRRDNGIVNVCSGRPVTVRELVERAVQARGASIRLNLGHYPYPDYEPMEFWGTTEKLKSCLERK